MDYYFVLPSRHNSGKNIVKLNLQLTWPVRLFSMKSLKTHIIFSVSNSSCKHKDYRNTTRKTNETFCSPKRKVLDTHRVLR